MFWSKKTPQISFPGEVFQTYDATLNRYPNTLLGNRMHRLKFMNEETGEIYLDRNVKAFESIFYYYQSKVNSKANCIFMDVNFENFRNPYEIN